MSASFTNKAGTFTILNGQTVSNPLTRVAFEDAGWLGIVAPTNLNTASGFTIEVTDDPLTDLQAVSGSVNWRTLVRDNGAGTLYNVPLPGADQALGYPDLTCFSAIRIACSGAPNANTSFTLMKNWVARG